MSAPEKLPQCFWLTRDKIFGELSSRVDVWAVEPVREEIAGRDVIWCSPDGADVDSEDTCLGDWSCAEAHRHVGNGIPCTDRECVRVGDPVTLGESGEQVLS